MAERTLVPGGYGVRPRTNRDASALRVSRTRETLREKTVLRLRESILNQFFEPGERLIERELCELTGVSRTSVREALRQLESEGLIETIPNRGPVVTSLGLEDAMRIYEVREALEGLAARLFVERASDELVESLAQAGEDMISAAIERNTREVPGRLDAFYGILFEGCGNAIAASLIRTLRARMHYLRATTAHRESESHTRVAVRNFRQIVAAVKKRDAQAAASACTAQVRYAAKVAREVLGSDPARGCSDW